MIPITFIILNFIHALWHWYLIKKNRLIQSGQKTIEYSIGSLLAGVILKATLGCPLFPLILFAILTRLAWFDIFLNLLRGKNIFYEGVTGKYKSFYDWLEAQSGIPIPVFRIFYLVVFIAYTLIYYL